MSPERIAAAKRERWARLVVYDLNTWADNLAFWIRHPITWAKCMGWLKHKPSMRA